VLTILISTILTFRKAVVAI